MFAKLLKHEWQATRGVIGLLCVIILVCGLMIGCSAHYLIWVEESTMVVIDADGDSSNVLSVLCVLLMMAGAMAMAVCAAGSVFAVTWRFYKSRFTDEGYLTFTLPVTHHQLLLSSLLNSILGVLAVIAACILAALIVAALFLLAVPQQIVWADAWVSLGEAWQQILASLSQNSREFLSLGIGTVIGFIASLIQLMLAVTIGALVAKKHKILAAVGVYYGINLGLSFIQMLFAMSAAFSQSFSLLMNSATLLSAAVAVGGYFLMYWLTSRKLNLT